MLISMCVAYLLLGGSAVSGFTKQLDRISATIKKEVTVDSTKKSALAIVDQATKENKAFVEKQKSTQSALVKVLAVRAATTAQIDSALIPIAANDSVFVTDMVDASMKLRQTLTAAEWAKVFPPPVEQKPKP